MSQLHARLLAHAAEKLGGTEELARYLAVSELRVRVWRRGLIAPPDDVFLKLVDLMEAPPPARPPGSRASTAKES